MNGNSDMFDILAPLKLGSHRGDQPHRFKRRFLGDQYQKVLIFVAQPFFSSLPMGDEFYAFSPNSSSETKLGNSDHRRGGNQA